MVLTAISDHYLFTFSLSPAINLFHGRQQGNRLNMGVPSQGLIGIVCQSIPVVFWEEQGDDRRSRSANRVLEEFADLEDPRQQAKVLYPLEEILLLCLCAVISGADCWVEVALSMEGSA